MQGTHQHWRVLWLNLSSSFISTTPSASCLSAPSPFHLSCLQENVEGENCDRCKLGFYNLQRDNQRGCKKCSCMGVSSLCSASTWTYQNVGNTQYNTNTILGHASIKYRMIITYTFYFIMSLLCCSLIFFSITILVYKTLGLHFILSRWTLLSLKLGNGNWNVWQQVENNEIIVSCGCGLWMKCKRWGKENWTHKRRKQNTWQVVKRKQFLTDRWGEGEETLMGWQLWFRHW